MKRTLMLFTCLLLSVSKLAIASCDPTCQYNVSKDSIEILDSHGNTLSYGNFLIAGTTVKQAQTFTRKLQQLVAKKKISAIAALVHYPLRVNGKNEKISNAADFIRYYSIIFTPPVKKAIVSQCLKGLFANSQGVAIGSGQLWFAPDSQGTLKIIAINH